MGTPIQPPGPGDLCSRCWGSNDSAFGGGETPLSFSVEVSGILKGALWTIADPEPPSGIYFVTQFLPCTFKSTFSPWQAFVSFQIFTECAFITAGILRCFIAQPNEECITDFVNELVNPNDKYYNGEAHVLF